MRNTVESIKLSNLYSNIKENRLISNEIKPLKFEFGLINQSNRLIFEDLYPCNSNNKKADVLLDTFYEERLVDDKRMHQCSALKGTSKKLALRADVMNKTLFRALRRQIKIHFYNFLSFNRFSTSKSQRIFSANLKRYSDYLIKNHSTNFKAIYGKFKFYLAQSWL